MSLQTRLYLFNTGESSVIFCVQIDEVCTSGVLSTCSTQDIIVVNPGEIQIKDITGSDKEFICISAWSGVVPNTNQTPNSSESIQINSATLAIEINWNGFNITATDYCSIVDMTSNPNGLISIYLNSIDQSTALVCSSPASDINECDGWTLENNPCVSDSPDDLIKLPGMSTILIDQMTDSTDKYICLGVWGSNNSSTPSMVEVPIGGFTSGVDLRWTGLRVLKTLDLYTCGTTISTIATPSNLPEKTENFVSEWWWLFLLLMAGVVTMVVLFIYINSPHKTSA